MSSLNRHEIIGNLGRDPEIRVAQNGTKVATLSVATSEQWKDRTTGEKKEHTDWHRVVIFGPLAEIAEKYLHRGSKVFLAGKVQTRKWQDQNGQDRYSTETVLSGFAAELKLLDGKGSGGGNRPPDHPGPDPDGPPQPGDRKRDDLEDEIPF